MRKVPMIIENAVTKLGTGMLMLCPAVTWADSDRNIQSFAARINGESLMYFMLLLFIGYLFFRKPLP